MSSNNYYDSIDIMPLFNWRRCQEHDEVIFCRIDMTLEDKRKYTTNKDVVAWEKIYDTFIAEFGLGVDFERIDELREQIAKLQCNFVIQNVQYIRNEIAMLKAELEELLSRPVDGDMDTCIIHLSKWMGYKIDEKETTVRQFYKMLREYEKEIALMNKQAS